MTETITVAKIDQPAPGRKQGTIHDTNGGRWKAWGDKLQNYQIGSTYTITYKTNSFNGTQFNVIENAVLALQGSPQQVTKAADLGRAITATDDKRSEDIAVLALVKPWIEKIPVGDTEALVHAIRVCRVAWRNSAVMKPLPSRIESGPQNAEDFGDQIPDFQ